MNERIETTWCTRCGQRFTDEELVNAKACPACGSPGIPCAAANDVQVWINWHELRILGIWASNWADRFDDEMADSRETLQAILMRLQNQHPDKDPLTLFGDIQKVQEMPEVSGKVEHNVSKPPSILVNGPGAVRN